MFEVLAAVLVSQAFPVSFLQEAVVLEAVELVMFGADLTLDEELYDSGVWS